MEDHVLKSPRAIDASVTPITMATPASFPLVTKTASLTVCLFVICVLAQRLFHEEAKNIEFFFRKNEAFLLCLTRQKIAIF